MARKRRRNRPSPHGPNAEKVAKITQPRWTLPAYEIASTEQLQLLHDKSMQILEEGGIAFYDDESVRILQQHNVKVVDQVAYFDRAQVMEWLAKAPSQFVWAGRNPEHNVVMGGEHVIFAPVVGPPFVRDLDRGRRDGTLQDLNNFIKLSQTIPYLHTLGAEIVVPSDVPIAYRHLETMYSLLAYGDKPVMGIYHTGPISADAVQMAKIVHGEEILQQNHFLHGVVNVSSPRRLDDRMLGLAH